MTIANLMHSKTTNYLNISTTQENVSHYGSTTTGKLIIGLLCKNVGWLKGGGSRLFRLLKQYFS